MRFEPVRSPHEESPREMNDRDPRDDTVPDILGLTAIVASIVVFAAMLFVIGTQLG